MTIVVYTKDAKIYIHTLDKVPFSVREILFNILSTFFSLILLNFLIDSSKEEEIYIYFSLSP